MMTTQVWDDNAPHLIQKLFIKKNGGTPRTPGTTYRYISSITHWSQQWHNILGGAPYYSPIYDSDDPLPGGNLFGKIATKYRNKVIESMKKTWLCISMLWGCLGSSLWLFLFFTLDIFLNKIIQIDFTELMLFFPVVCLWSFELPSMPSYIYYYLFHDYIM